MLKYLLWVMVMQLCKQTLEKPTFFLLLLVPSEYHNLHSPQECTEEILCNEEVYQLLSSLMLQKPMAQMGFLLEHWNTLLQAVPPTGGWGSNRGSLPRTPSVRGALNDAELFQTRSAVHYSHPSLGPFHCIHGWFEVSLLFGFALTLLTQTSNIAHFILRD